MTTLPEATTTDSTYRSAGWAAITSGVFGIMAFGVLIVAVAYMVKLNPDLSGFVNLMFKTHHVGVILQSLFMIQVVFGLHTLAGRRFPSVSRGTFAVGVVSLSVKFSVRCSSSSTSWRTIYTRFRKASWECGSWS